MAQLQTRANAVQPAGTASSRTGSAKKKTARRALRPHRLAAVGAALLLALLVGLARPAAAQDRVGPKPQDGPWAAGQVITIPQLAAQLKHGAHPVILQVGFHVLYLAAHIPGAIYCGPTMQPEGVARLKKEAASLPRGRELVLYCGCCPWQRCPNIRPAFEALKGLGFKNLKVLYVPGSFAQDWVQKHLPTSKVK